MVELNSVILFVNDLAATVGFYRDLLGLKEIFKDEISSVLGLGSSTLVLHRSDLGHQGREPASVLLRVASAEPCGRTVIQGCRPDGMPCASRWKIQTRCTNV